MIFNVNTINDIEKTSQPDNTNNSLSDKTLRPDSDEKTALSENDITDEKTQQPGNDNEPNLRNENGVFEPYYVIDGQKYNYIEAISTGLTGEADVLLVEKEDEKFALKLYKKNYTPNIQIFEEVKTLSKFEFVVPLYSYGVWTKPDGSEKGSYELMKYIPNKSLDKLQLNKDENLLRKIAFNAAKCIDFCHRKKILHRDIKPGNFFFSDDDCNSLILGDFGVSDFLQDDGYSYSTQSGTNTYNAPEVYLVAEKKVRLNCKSDFYSLGILLMSLWMGETKFRAEMGDKEGKGRLFDLRDRKAEGKLPYPTDLSPDLILLIKGLTIPDEKKRWGFEEIKKWAKGEIKQLDISVIVRNDIPFMFDETKGYVAHTPEELAEYMDADRDYAIKILKRGKVTDWLKKCNRDKMATEIDDIVNTVKNNNGCVMRSVFTLDPKKPLKSERNITCTTLSDIAAGMFDVKPDSSFITDPHSDFYCYLLSHKMNDLSDKCYEIATKNQIDPQIEIVYVLDPNQPYYVYDIVSKKNISCNTVEEIVNVFKKRNGNILDHESEEFLSEKFYRWLRARDVKILDKIQNEIENVKSRYHIWCLLYNLDLRCSYELTLSADEGACHKTSEEIAQLINENAIRFYCINKGNSVSDNDKEAESFIYYLHHLKGSRLHYYLKSKGVFSKQIDWINFCYEIDSKTNTKKCSVYNETIATWKTIKGLLGKDNFPAYYFPKSNKNINTLNELSSMDESEIQQEADKGFLLEWLTVFFHENPYVDVSKKYDFERLADKYLRFIQTIYPKQQTVKRFEMAQNGILGKVSKTKRNVWTLISLRILAAILFILPILALMVSLGIWGLPFNENPLPKFSFVIILIGIIFGIVIFFYDNTEGFFDSIWGGLFISAVLYYVVFFLLHFLMPYSSWVLIGLLAFFAFFIIKKCYWNLPLNIKPNGYLLKMANDFDATVVQPLFFAFKSKENNYYYQYSADFDNYISYLKSVRNKLIKYFIPSIILVGGLIFLMMKITPALGGKQIEKKKTNVETLTGTWTGTFGVRTAKMNVIYIDKEQIRADISIKFKKLVKEEFSGNYSGKTQQIILYDNNRYNGILDGNFSGTLNDSLNIFQGKYRNYSTGKEYEFSFTRDKTDEFLNK